MTILVPCDHIEKVGRVSGYYIKSIIIVTLIITNCHFFFFKKKKNQNDVVSIVIR